jgi:hypothetical protein
MLNGLGHQYEDDPVKDGSMAIFCPACPQPGINLPADWKERYTPYVFIEILPMCLSEYVQRNHLIRTFIMDGNFSAEHMRCRTGDAEVPLSPGMAFMANPDSYTAHLNTGKEIAQVSGICSYDC